MSDLFDAVKRVLRDSNTAEVLEGSVVAVSANEAWVNTTGSSQQQSALYAVAVSPGDRVVILRASRNNRLIIIGKYNHPKYGTLGGSGGTGYNKPLGLSSIHLADSVVFYWQSAATQPALFEVQTNSVAGDTGAETVLVTSGNYYIIQSSTDVYCRIRSVMGADKSAWTDWASSNSSRTANLFLAGPASGDPATPTWREIASADLSTALLTPPPFGTNSPNTVYASAFRLTTGASNGYVLTSDTDGDASWQPAVVPLTVREQDGEPSIAGVSEIRVSNGKLTNQGSGIVSLDLSSSSLTVQEQDGTPSVAGVSTIKFPNTTVTDEGSGVVRVASIVPPVEARYSETRTLLYENTLVSDGDTWDIDGIPQAYDHLEIAIQIRGSNASYAYSDGVLFLNDDTTKANYQTARIAYGPNNGSWSASLNEPRYLEMTGGNNPSTVWTDSLGRIDWYSVAGRQKTIHARSIAQHGSTSWVYGFLHHILSSVTDAITRIRIQPGDAVMYPFKAGSHIRITGIRNEYVAANPNVDQSQIIYVGKHGSDSNTGLRPETAKLTIQAGITAASALTPSASNRITVKVMDSGTYVEALTNAQYVSIHAPNATLSGSIVSDGDNAIHFGRMVAADDGGYIFRKNNNNTSCYLTFNEIDGSGFNNVDCIRNPASNGILFVNGGKILVGPNGRGIGSNTGGSTGHTHLSRVGDIYLAGDNAVGVQALGDKVVGHIDRILETGNPTGAVGVSVDATGSAYLSINEIIADIACDVTSGGILQGFCGQLSGAEVGTHTLVISNRIVGSQSPNYVYAAPNGSAGAPTFRALVAADIADALASPTAIGSVAQSTIKGTTVTATSAGSNFAGMTNTGNFVVTSTGAAPTFEGAVDGAFNLNTIFDTWGAGNTGSRFIGRHAGGTKASPSQTKANHELMYFDARGHNGTGYVSNARAAVELYATEDWSSTANGTGIRLRITTDGTVTLVTMLQFDSSGGVRRMGLFGNTPVARPTYGAPTGAATRTAFATGSVTLSQLAERVKAIIDDLRARGDFA